MHKQLSRSGIQKIFLPLKMQQQAKVQPRNFDGKLLIFAHKKNFGGMVE
jgi:hypothetical protein